MSRSMLVWLAGYLFLGGLASFMIAAIVALGGPPLLVGVLLSSAVVCWAAAVRVAYVAWGTAARWELAAHWPLWVALSGMTLGVVSVPLFPILVGVLSVCGLGPYAEEVISIVVAVSLALGGFAGLALQLKTPS